MLQVEKLDTNSKKQVDRYIKYPFRLYVNCPQWVPPIIGDIKKMLNRQKHPYYEHSEAEFFLAIQDGEVVGRIAAMINHPFNTFHGTKKGQFYHFESIDDQTVVNALFERTFEWMREKGMNEVVGPKGFGAFDGYGIQVEGLEHRQMMMMMNYNLSYYPKLLENLGFEKAVDFISCYININKYRVPEKVKEIARRVKERDSFVIKTFSTKKELLSWAWRIGDLYNRTFVDNWEYYPLSDREIEFLRDDILAFANPRLIKLVMRKEQIVGFIFGFPDISAALQRMKGKLTPWGIFDLLLEMRRTKWISLNGAGILPKYHGRGGNALLYTEIAQMIRDHGFEHAEQTQMADTAVQIRRDMVNIGAIPYKTHRVYHRRL